MNSELLDMLQDLPKRKFMVETNSIRGTHGFTLNKQEFRASIRLGPICVRRISRRKNIPVDYMHHAVKKGVSRYLSNAERSRETSTSESKIVQCLPRTKLETTQLELLRHLHLRPPQTYEVTSDV